MKTILEMKHVTKRFPGVIALKDVSLKVKEGEILAICGENGAGKSTLMKILSGSYAKKDYEGELWIDGKPVDFTSVAIATKQGIEMVYQEMNMMLDASIAENVFVGNLPGDYGFVNYKQLYANAQKILDEIGLPIRPQEKVRRLNSGQMQMLAIMRAMSKNPRIMVLDEPTSALTDEEVDLLMRNMDRLRKNGVTILFITHKLDEIFRIADRVAVMRDGEFISVRSVNDVNNETLVEEMVGRKIENLYPKTHMKIGEEVLKVENLTIPHPIIKERNIVENISFSLRRGEILGIGGLVGAGRSEVLGAIFGQITNVKMKLTVFGKPVTILNPSDAISSGLGFVTEDRKRNGFVWIMSVRANLTLASLREMPKRWFIDRNTEKKLATGIFDKLRVKAPSIEMAIVNLSGGNQQKVVLGKWLLKNPRILLIDEPTKGIDVGAKAEIYSIMNDLTKAGISIIMVSSDMPELVSMSDRVIVLASGRITGEFNRGNITQDNIMRAAIIESL